MTWAQLIDPERFKIIQLDDEDCELSPADQFRLKIEFNGDLLSIPSSLRVNRLVALVEITQSFLALIAFVRIRYSGVLVTAISSMLNHNTASLEGMNRTGHEQADHVSPSVPGESVDVVL